MKSSSISKKLTTYEGTCWIFTSSGRRYGGKILEKFSPRGGRTEGSENASPYIGGVLEFLFFHCGPLIKRCPNDQTQQTQEHVSEQKNKESE